MCSIKAENFIYQLNNIVKKHTIINDKIFFTIYLMHLTPTVN